MQFIKKHLPDSVFAILYHIKRYKELPNIFNPKTLNEKILHRKLFDRRPILTAFADKYLAAHYVMNKIGGHILPEIYWVTENPETIPFDKLPDKFVIKPTHGSGWVKIVTDKSDMDRVEIINTCNHWLSQNFYEIGREWAYKNIKPQIIVEELIEDGNGLSPNDYKLFTYNGQPRYIQIDSSRFEGHKRDFYTPEWERLPVSLTYPNSDKEIPKPKHLQEMLQAAKTIGIGMDFVRIDFYDTDKKLYFGEITTTPGNGLERFMPQKYDLEFGKFWNI